MFNGIPFVRYLLVLLTGIFAGILIPASDSLAIAYCLVFSLLASLGLIVLYGSRNYIARSSLYFSVIVLGWSSASFQGNRYRNSLNEVIKTEYDAYQIIIRSLPEKRDKNIRYEAELERLISETKDRQVYSKLLVYFRSDIKELPSLGQRLIIKGTLTRPKTPASDFSFDYSRYLERQEIPWIGYVRKSDQIYKIPDSQKIGLRNQLLVLSEKSDAIFRDFIKDDEAYGLVKAMILGRRDDISAELNTAYINSGTVHILSVSGLHVAIFFAVLHFIFAPLRKREWGKYLYVGILSTILVAYAVITGLPASVQRATIMCIIWMLAGIFSRRQVPVNTLSLSAFVILLADPNAIFDVGFQLSFLAMLGIFLLTKPILSLYEPRNRIIKHVWNLSAMSIAAQLMTFPVVTYYFNQFPTYFLFANLLAVDLAGLLIPLAFVLLSSGIIGISWLMELSGTILNYLAMLVNYVVKIPRSLPFFLVRNLYFDLSQCFLSLALFLTLYGAFYTRAKQWLWSAVALVFGFSLYSSVKVISDYDLSFTATLANESALLYKKRGSLLVLELEPGGSGAYMFNQELGKYMARYGSDTTIVRLP